tara:strand:- start:308 stop:2098 length:1791 start_codon:yes stop_codon:yes gene_type:complete
MVVSGVSMLDVPPLRGNPFDSRPIERSRAHEIVGRDSILSKWREHMHSQSPRMLLLVGERGSGRTSLINAISSQTNSNFVGYYWHNEDPLNRALDEIAVTFCGHEVPPTMHQKVERLVEALDSENGPLPLIAFDYPSDVEIPSFLSLILPVLQRLRALVVVSLSNSQLLAIDDSLKEAFDETAHIEPFSNGQIQALCDIRIRRMSREKWTIHPELLESIRSRTGGNARSVVNILRDLIDEKRGLGSDGTLEALTKWGASHVSISEPQERSETEIEDFSSIVHSPTTDIRPEDDEEETSEGEREELWPDSGFPVGDEEDWDEEPDDMWDQEEETPLEGPDETNEPKDPERITDWTAEEGTLLSMEEGTEPPVARESPRGFSGLVSRSKITNDGMPTGPDYSTPIQEPEVIQPSNQHQASTNGTSNPQPEASEITTKSVSTGPVPPEEKSVFHSEGELWTVDSELEETLPEPSDNAEPELADEAENSDFEAKEGDAAPENRSDRKSISMSPIWESGPTLDESRLSSLSDSERLVVSIASEREISPSDAVIQARLEVGRPRLSQIYNSLHKSGILSARKEGRSRLFKLSDAASDLLIEG